MDADLKDYFDARFSEFMNLIRKGDNIQQELFNKIDMLRELIGKNDTAIQLIKGNLDAGQKRFTHIQNDSEKDRAENKNRCDNIHNNIDLTGINETINFVNDIKRSGQLDSIKDLFKKTKHGLNKLDIIDGIGDLIERLNTLDDIKSLVLLKRSVNKVLMVAVTAIAGAIGVAIWAWLNGHR